MSRRGSRKACVFGARVLCRGPDQRVESMSCGSQSQYLGQFSRRCAGAGAGVGVERRSAGSCTGCWRCCRANLDDRHRITPSSPKQSAMVTVTQCHVYSTVPYPVPRTVSRMRPRNIIASPCGDLCIVTAAQRPSDPIRSKNRQSQSQRQREPWQRYRHSPVKKHETTRTL